jgi:hypothetical protein
MPPQTQCSPSPSSGDAALNAIARDAPTRKKRNIDNVTTCSTTLPPFHCLSFSKGRAMTTKKKSKTSNNQESEAETLFLSSQDSLFLSGTANNADEQFLSSLFGAFKNSRQHKMEHGQGDHDHESAVADVEPSLQHLGLPEFDDRRYVHTIPLPSLLMTLTQRRRRSTGRYADGTPVHPVSLSFDEERAQIIEGC